MRQRGMGRDMNREEQRDAEGRDGEKGKCAIDRCVRRTVGVRRRRTAPMRAAGEGLSQRSRVEGVGGRVGRRWSGDCLEMDCA